MDGFQLYIQQQQTAHLGHLLHSVHIHSSYEGEDQTQSTSFFGIGAHLITLQSPHSSGTRSVMEIFEVSHSSLQGVWMSAFS